LRTRAGFGGWRLELDGQITEASGDSMTVRMRPNAATVVAFDGQEPLLSGLRRRGLIVDSPRMVADQSDGRA
jgi:NAD+ kinase